MNNPKHSKPTLSRRHVLRGAGVAMTLPWLESLAPRKATAQGAAIKRYLSVYTPNGAPAAWDDAGPVGTNFELSRIQAPFESLKSKMLMVRRLANFTWRRDLLDIKWDSELTRKAAWCDGCVVPLGAYLSEAHAQGMGSYSTCKDGDDWRDKNGLNERTSPKNPQTIDQVIADQVGSATSRPSMQLGIFNGDGILDRHHANISREMAYDKNGNVLNKQLDPRAVFDDLVGVATGPDPAIAERRRALDLSVLDSVQQSVTTLSPKLGAADRAQLDQFLTSTRDLEQRVNMVAQGPSCGDPNARPAAGMLIPGEVGYRKGDQPEVTADSMLLRATTMNDLVVMALQCDATRVMTYQFDNSRTDLVYSWLRQPDGSKVNAFHDETHVRFDKKPASPPGFETISQWMNGVCADLVTKLDKIPEGDGTSLLDNSVVLYGSDMHNADHAAWDLPIIIFGGGAGTFKRGELVDLPLEISQMRQLRDLYYTIANEYFGLNIQEFGEDRRGVPNELLTEVLA